MAGGSNVRKDEGAPIGLQTLIFENCLHGTQHDEAIFGQMKMRETLDFP